MVCFRIRTPHPGPDPPHRRPKRLNRAGYGAEPLSACSAGLVEFERSREAARHDISLVRNGVISSGLTCPDSPKTVLTAPAGSKHGTYSVLYRQKEKREKRHGFT